MHSFIEINSSFYRELGQKTGLDQAKAIETL
jgi:hypothetical protein